MEHASIGQEVGDLYLTRKALQRSELMTIAEIVKNKAVNSVIRAEGKHKMQILFKVDRAILIGQ